MRQLFLYVFSSIRIIIVSAMRNKKKSNSISLLSIHFFHEGLLKVDKRLLNTFTDNNPGIINVVGIAITPCMYTVLLC